MLSPLQVFSLLQVVLRRLLDLVVVVWLRLGLWLAQHPEGALQHLHSQLVPTLPRPLLPALFLDPPQPWQHLALVSAPPHPGHPWPHLVQLLSPLDHVPSQAHPPLHLGLVLNPLVYSAPPVAWSPQLLRPSLLLPLLPLLLLLLPPSLLPPLLPPLPPPLLPVE